MKTLRLARPVPHEKLRVRETATAVNTHQSLKLPVPSLSTKIHMFKNKFDEYKKVLQRGAMKLYSRC
jgi:hypothetical protein